MSSSSTPRLDAPVEAPPRVNESSSYRQILRSSWITGGASVLNVLIGLLRTKAVAVLLGPAGVGLLSLFQSLVATASSIASLGFGNVGTRQIAEATSRANVEDVAAARRALFLGTVALALVGGTVFWVLREPLAEHLLGDVTLAGSVGWLAIAVSVTVASGSQSALLRGLHRVADMARVSVASALLSTAVGVGVLLVWRRDGLLAFLLIAPLANFVVGHVYVARLPKVRAAPTPVARLFEQWSRLARLGAAFMLAGLAVAAGQLVVRALVQRQLGPDALGQFQAAWVISMTYIGFVLTAMGADYYPRLTAAIHDPAAVNRMANEQTEVALLLSGPMFVAMLGLAPWIIGLLYTSSFADAAVVLRWQVLGDVLKVASWPLGFITLSAGDARAYMSSETLAITAFAGLCWLGLPILGLEATGLAFVGMYAVYLPVVYWLARRRTGFRWTSRVARHILVLVLAASGVSGLGAHSARLGLAAGVAAAVAFGVHSMVRLSSMTGLGGPVGRLTAMIGQALSKKRPLDD